jgi:hypothetical protein
MPATSLICLSWESLEDFKILPISCRDWWALPALVFNHMFNAPLLFFKSRKKILRFDLPAPNQNNQQNNGGG